MGFRCRQVQQFKQKLHHFFVVFPNKIFKMPDAIFSINLAGFEPLNLQDEKERKKLSTDPIRFIVTAHR